MGNKTVQNYIESSEMLFGFNIIKEHWAAMKRYEDMMYISIYKCIYSNQPSDDYIIAFNNIV